MRRAFRPWSARPLSAARLAGLLLPLLLLCGPAACGRPAPPPLRPAPQNPVAAVPDGDLARASGLLDDAGTDDPEAVLESLGDRADASSRLARVRALRRLGRFNESAAEANRLILADPAPPAPLLARAFVARARTLHAAGSSDRALEDCATALDIRPGDLDALLTQGDIFFALEMPGPAEASYGRAIEAAPQNPLGYLNRGVARDEQGRFEEAIADYDRALALDPGSATAYANRGVSRSQAGDVSGMCADYRRACELGQCRRLTDALLMGYCQGAR